MPHSTSQSPIISLTPSLPSPPHQLLLSQAPISPLHSPPSPSLPPLSNIPFTSLASSPFSHPSIFPLLLTTSPPTPPSNSAPSPLPHSYLSPFPTPPNFPLLPHLSLPLPASVRTFYLLHFTVLPSPPSPLSVTCSPPPPLPRQVAEKRMVEVTPAPVSPLVGVFLGLVGGFVFLLLAGVFLSRGRSHR